MPRYHFHIVDGHQLSDVKGIELPSEEAARQHAQELAESFTRPYRAVRVVTHDGNELFRVDVPDRK